MPVEASKWCARVAAVLNLPRILTVLFCLLLAGRSGSVLADDSTPLEVPGEPEAQHVPRPVPPDSSELDAIALELGLGGTGEAVLLVFSSAPFDLLRVGTRLMAPELPDKSHGVRQLVRDLKEGIVAVELGAGARSWEGQVQLLSGAVSLVDVDSLLDLPATGESPAVEVPAFDLFAFYDELDARGAMADKLVYCAEVTKALTAGPDRTLVEQACGRFERKVEQDRVRDEEIQRLVEDPDELVGELLADDSEEQPESNLQPVLYQVDGTLRVRPRGTTPRAIVGASAFALSGASLVGSLYWEYRAQQEYQSFRKAEQFGEDTAMTEHFFYSQEHDQRRNAAIAVATAALSAGIFAAIWQRIEGERFRKARAELRGSESGRTGASR